MPRRQNYGQTSKNTENPGSKRGHPLFFLPLCEPGTFISINCVGREGPPDSSTLGRSQSPSPVCRFGRDIDARLVTEGRGDRRGQFVPCREVGPCPDPQAGTVITHRGVTRRESRHSRDARRGTGHRDSDQCGSPGRTPGGCAGRAANATPGAGPPCSGGPRGPRPDGTAGRSGRRPPANGRPRPGAGSGFAGSGLVSGSQDTLADQLDLRAERRGAWQGAVDTANEVPHAVGMRQHGPHDDPAESDSPVGLAVIDRGFGPPYTERTNPVVPGATDGSLAPCSEPSRGAEDRRNATRTRPGLFSNSPRIQTGPSGPFLLKQSWPP